MMEQSRNQNGTAKLISKVAKLVDLVGCQESAVVSRTIMSNKAGTVTLFAFDAGQSLGEHTAPFAALAHLLEGEAEIVIAAQTFSLRQGEMIVMPANQPHAVNATARFKMILIMLKEPKP
jgi:quercetin dioxygenase-like cupin family protein